MTGTPVIEVLATGLAMSLQDGGRAGWRRFGVPPGGAMDRHAAAAANRLVGNPDDAPALEMLLQGQRLRVLEDTWIGLAGAAMDGSLRPWTAERFSGGAILEFPCNRSGVWAYLAVPGGFVSEKWFGSVSADLRSGIGRSARPGDVLAAGTPTATLPPLPVVRRALRPEAVRDYSRPPELRLLPAPQYDAFSAPARQRLVDTVWTISARSDRTGYRLEGEALEVPASIPSEPVLPGSLQVPGDGRPIVTLNDGPTVGGYPKIAILRDEDRDWLVQCRPGTQIRFRWSD